MSDFCDTFLGRYRHLQRAWKHVFLIPMSKRWLQFFRGAFDSEPALHPLDHGMAKKYIKQRLAVVYPDLKNNPTALEKAYQALNLEPRAGIGRDEAPTVFELTLPESVG